MGRYNIERIKHRLGTGGGLIPAIFLEFSVIQPFAYGGVIIWGNPYPPWHPGIPNFYGVPEIRPFS